MLFVAIEGLFYVRNFFGNRVRRATCRRSVVNQKNRRAVAVAAADSTAP